MQNYIAIEIYSSGSTLKVVIKDYKTNRRCDLKNSDRAFPVAAVTCFDRHDTKSLFNIFNLNKVLLPMIFWQKY